MTLSERLQQAVDNEARKQDALVLANQQIIANDQQQTPDAIDTAERYFDTQF